MTNIYRPTWLMIKKHNVTGLKYFCKTTKKNPYTYSGSGHYWIRHISKYGKKEVETIWAELFTDKEKLTEYAVKFSIDNNIVESEEWANLKIENGLDGGGIPGMGKGIPKSEIHKQKCSKSLTGRKFTQSWKNNLSTNHANVSGGNNPKAKTWKITDPNGNVSIINGTMDQFCQNNNLPATTMRGIGRTGKSPKSGLCINWKVELIS